MIVTRDGEDALTGAARAWLAGSATVADLFSGLGTFAFALLATHLCQTVEAGDIKWIALCPVTEGLGLTVARCNTEAIGNIAGVASSALSAFGTAIDSLAKLKDYTSPAQVTQQIGEQSMMNMDSDDSM